jgi:hypothetical protein
MCHQVLCWGGIHSWPDFRHPTIGSIDLKNPLNSQQAGGSEWIKITKVFIDLKNPLNSQQAGGSEWIKITKVFLWGMFPTTKKIVFGSLQ